MENTIQHCIDVFKKAKKVSGVRRYEDLFDEHKKEIFLNELDKNRLFTLFLNTKSGKLLDAEKELINVKLDLSIQQLIFDYLTIEKSTNSRKLEIYIKDKTNIELKNFITLYHGTNNVFDKFDPNSIKANGDDYGTGIYFSTNENLAKSYTKTNNIMKVLLPKDIISEKHLASYKKHNIDEITLCKIVYDLVKVEMEEDGYSYFLSDYYGEYYEQVLDDNSVIQEIIEEVVSKLISKSNYDMEIINELFSYFNFNNEIKLSILVKHGVFYSKPEKDIILLFNLKDIIY